MSKLDGMKTASRIKVAKLESPIVVLTMPDSTEQLFEAWFGDTVYGSKYLNAPCSRFMGVYFGEKDAEKFMNEARGITNEG